MSRVALVSFRLGGTDGVAIEAAKWQWALTQLGHEVITVAGEGTADRVIEGLGLSPAGPLNENLVNQSLHDVDLVVAENILSLPLNLTASQTLARVLQNRPVIVRHHDLASQREHLRHLFPPPTSPTWRHVTINELSQRELLDVGIPAVVMPNRFDCDPPHGQREETRQQLGVDGPLLLFPSRVIPRKNVGAAIALAEQVNGTLWILGGVEDGFDDEFTKLCEGSSVEIRMGALPGTTIHDAYAACDVVVVSSTWEGFGNPVIESATHRRPLAVNYYPVLHELITKGLYVTDIHDVVAVRTVINHADAAQLESNVNVVRQHFNINDLPGFLEPLVRDVLTSATL